MLEEANGLPSRKCFVGPTDLGGWKRHSFPFGAVWFCGHLYSHADPGVALARWPESDAESEIARFLDGLDGHFSIICEKPAVTIAAVDPVRSIPIFFAETGGETKISASSTFLVNALHLDAPDLESAKVLAMAGYTVGSRTLYRDLQQLAPGEFLIAGTGVPRRARYHRYSPWLVVDDSDENYQSKLAKMTIGLFEQTVTQASGRQIAVPLSAGRDSRLIISALAEIGAQNVVCFAYGLPGNYEMKASEQIARHVGYEWHFVPFTPASQRQFWSSEDNRAYQSFADSSCSTTVVHDFPAIKSLLDQRIIDRSSIVVNGNSGDYITGLHIQAPVDQGLGELAPPLRKKIVIDTLIKKHFRLWNALATPPNDQIVEKQLRSEIELLGLDEGSETQAHGIYEYLEFQDRQSKYVISRQRIYEFLDVEWRLPLWSRAYLDFWQHVPLRLKRGQSLYARMLHYENWGGV